MGRRLVKTNESKEFSKDFTKKIIEKASLEDLQEYINGCYTKYGTSPMTYEEGKIDLLLPNGMIAVFGVHPEDGISCDVYTKEGKLLFLEHGIITNVVDKNSSTDVWVKSRDMLLNIAINRLIEMKLM